MFKKIGTIFVLLILFIVGFSTQPVIADDFLELVKDANIESVQEAIDEGADINTRNEEGMTALMFAAWNTSNPEIINILLDNGADGSLKCERNRKTAFDYAKENEDIKGTEVYWKLNDAQYE